MSEGYHMDSDVEDIPVAHPQYVNDPELVERTVWCLFRNFRGDEALLGIYSTEAKASSQMQALQAVRKRHIDEVRYVVQKRIVG